MDKRTTYTSVLSKRALNRVGVVSTILFTLAVGFLLTAAGLPSLLARFLMGGN